MNTRTTLTTLAATTLATLALHTAAGATTGTCTLTAQPQDERSYHLAYTDKDGMHVLINRQDSTPLKPTNFEIPADFDTVLWATKTGRIDGPDSFYDHLVNAGDCQFTEPYHAAPGWRASIVIAPGNPSSPPETWIPTTTIQVPPSTSTSARPTPTAPPTTAPTGTTLPPVTVTRVTELPPATFPPTWPEQPGTTLPDKLDEVRLTPDPTPYTAVPVLPKTGVNSGDLAQAGIATAALGGLFLALAAAYTPLRRAMRRNHTERNFDAS